MSEPPRGRTFEFQIGEMLDALQRRHPDNVQVVRQPRFELHDGQELIPDFDLRFDLLFERGHYLVECQDRKRSSPQVAQKIRYMKALSSRNRFIFVHAREIPEATRKALSADGVMVMSMAEFASFVARLELQMRRQGDDGTLRNSDFHGGFRPYFPPGLGPSDFHRGAS